MSARDCSDVVPALLWQQVSCHHRNHLPADHSLDEVHSDAEEEQDLFVDGQDADQLAQAAQLRHPGAQGLEEAAADPAISRGGWEGPAATQQVRADHPTAAWVGYAFCCTGSYWSQWHQCTHGC